MAYRQFVDAYRWIAESQTGSTLSRRRARSNLRQLSEIPNMGILMQVMVLDEYKSRPSEVTRVFEVIARTIAEQRAYSKRWSRERNPSAEEMRIELARARVELRAVTSVLGYLTQFPKIKIPKNPDNPTSPIIGPRPNRPMGASESWDWAVRACSNAANFTVPAPRYSPMRPRDTDRSQTGHSHTRPFGLDGLGRS